jgi:hypothetical protein
MERCIPLVWTCVPIVIAVNGIASDLFLIQIYFCKVNHIRDTTLRSVSIWPRISLNIRNIEKCFKFAGVELYSIYAPIFILHVHAIFSILPLFSKNKMRMRSACCLCLCVSPSFVARQRLGKHVPTTANTYPQLNWIIGGAVLSP